MSVGFHLEAIFLQETIEIQQWLGNKKAELKFVYQVHLLTTTPASEMIAHSSFMLYSKKVKTIIVKSMNINYSLYNLPAFIWQRQEINNKN